MSNIPKKIKYKLVESYYVKGSNPLEPFFLSIPYYMFKFSVRSELTRKYYERRITRLLDFIEFSPYKDTEKY
jgi:hypothetical protein